MTAESIPSLQATVKLCDEAAAFAGKQVGTAIAEWWTQPAIDALPWQKCKQTNAYVCTCSGLQQVLLIVPCLVFTSFNQLLHGFDPPHL